MKASPITRQAQSRSRIRDLVAAVRAIRHERDQLVSELVWNEMRIGELRARLGEAGADPDRWRREIEQRLSFVASLAHWEAAADRALRAHCRRLEALISGEPHLLREFPELESILGRPGLDETARNAARELGLA